MPKREKEELRKAGRAEVLTTVRASRARLLKVEGVGERRKARGSTIRD